ncbi:MAG TPA: phosphate acyltransferase PlsX [Clostridia bacterium]|jgi:glycerol-3-phosphate acyltransferase PlsX|nr:phosphate acyltransferase PlsX [Clostridia bacterium]HHY05833.1 phosphate acyltransferase PlsX [Clostridia bacterium]
MKVVIDAMGGDHAPRAIVQGAIQALSLEQNLELILVGQNKTIKQCLPKKYDTERLSIYHCEEVITMDEHPAIAYRQKKDASITVATRLVKEKKGEAVISAGNTGAQMVAALFGLGRLPGIERPAIGTVMPGLAGPKLLLDAGANANCKPENLLQFAEMGNVYAEKILGIATPRIGLVSNGTEPSKGNELTLKTYELLQECANLNFIGNVEGRDVLAGSVDVLVCDGFVGNIILKVLEGTAGGIFTLFKEELQKNMRSKAGTFLLLPALKKIKTRLDYAEYGGAPLLGVKGLSIICHGSSNAYAIQNAIRVASLCIKKRMVPALEESISVQNSQDK